MRKLVIGLAAMAVGAFAATGAGAGVGAYEGDRIKLSPTAGRAATLRANPFSLERLGRPVRFDSGADDGALSQLRPQHSYRPSEDHRPAAGREDDELERQHRARRLCERVTVTPPAGGAVDRPEGGGPRRVQPSDDNGQQGRRRLANDERQWLNHEFGCRRG